MSISACSFGWFIESNYWHIIERSETDEKKTQQNVLLFYYIIVYMQIFDGIHSSPK